MPEMALRPKLLGALIPLLPLVLGLSLGDARALGLGRPQILSVLGQPLDASFPLMLADGEQLRESCLRAEVMAGDARMPAGLLQLRVEGEPGQMRVRLRSLVRVEEPALRVTLALGCPVQFTREFHALVDPAPAPAVAPAVPVVTAVVPPAAGDEARPLRNADASGSARVQAAPRAPLMDAVSVPALPPSAATASAERTRARPATRPRPAASSGPRLQLEVPEVLVGAAPSPAASAAVELTPELEQTLSRLEQTVAELRAELEARRAAAAGGAASAPQAPPSAAPRVVPAVPTVAAASASGYRDPMTWLMTLALSLLAGAAAFYASRWVDARQRRQREMWRTLRAARTSQANGVGFAPPVLADAVPLPDEGQHTATSPQPRPMPWVSDPLAVPPDIAPMSPPAGAVDRGDLTQPASLLMAATPAAAATSLGRATTALAPAVSADEWLDLLQQIDFLERLGQPESVDALLESRRQRAGMLPYLLQFELYQQRGDADGFARLAVAYEQAFDRTAPDWSQGLSQGRALDACPSVIAHLQVVWEDAAAALEMLGRLLTQGFGPGVPAFELPAYRDLLLLYAVARDRFETGQRSEDVDLMLPLDSRL